MVCRLSFFLYLVYFSLTILVLWTKDAFDTCVAKNKSKLKLWVSKNELARIDFTKVFSVNSFKYTDEFPNHFCNHGNSWCTSTLQHTWSPHMYTLLMVYFNSNALVSGFIELKLFQSNYFTLSRAVEVLFTRSLAKYQNKDGQCRTNVSNWI